METQTDTHILDYNIVKTYEWNEWELRRKALKMVKNLIFLSKISFLNFFLDKFKKQSNTFSSDRFQQLPQGQCYPNLVTKVCFILKFITLKNF